MVRVRVDADLVREVKEILGAKNNSEAVCLALKISLTLGRNEPPTKTRGRAQEQESSAKISHDGAPDRVNLFVAANAVI